MQHFVKTFCDAHKIREVQVPPETMKWVYDYPWPGNVRELKNALEAGVVLCRDGVLRSSDLQLSGLPQAPTKAAAATTDALSLDESERNAIVRALKQAGWVQKDAAQILGISRRAIHYKIKKYGIDTAGKRSSGDESQGD
jgi:DNA-binding NtrC family response regulator